MEDMRQHAYRLTYIFRSDDVGAVSSIELKRRAAFILCIQHAICIDQ